MWVHYIYFFLSLVDPVPSSVYRHIFQSCQNPAKGRSCSFQNNQNPVKFEIWHSNSVQSYLTPSRRCDPHQLSELTNVAFRATKILSIMRLDIPVDCDLQSHQSPIMVGVDIAANHSLQSHQNPFKFNRWPFFYLSELTNTLKTICFPSTIRVDNVVLRTTWNLEDTMLLVNLWSG